MFSSNTSQVSSDAVFIEDTFSCFLYTGNGSTQTITNGIDLAGKGGLVWIKVRNQSYDHVLVDTVRGANKELYSNTTGAQFNASSAGSVSGFSSTGYSLDYFGGSFRVNKSPETYASWTFRKQPKFFDVVTYTGNGVAGRTVAHNLGSVPGFLIVKNVSNTTNWFCWHRDMPNTNVMRLNSTIQSYDDTTAWNSTTPTAASFTVGTSIATNNSGDTYVAYLFAHNAGGFGLTGTDNVISCGSWSDSGTGTQTITLGYEPQFVMYKRTDEFSNWVMLDTMRAWPVVNAPSSTANLYPNLSNAEALGNYGGNGPTAIGFDMPTFGGGTYIYIAIRRGPMKTPTSGTSVFTPIARTGTGSATTQETGLNGTDLAFTLPRAAAGNNWQWVDRLRGGVAGSAARIQSNNTNQEFSDQSMSVLSSTQTTISYGGSGSNASSTSYIVECFRRAPGFFDEVCWTATGSAQTLSHNLQAVPELMIRKRRDSATGGQWDVYVAPLGATNKLILNDTSAVDANTTWDNTTPTSSVVYMNNTVAGWTFVTYLFASCPGVSKVGSYTGTGTTLQINCGFTAGARFVLIKRTDSTGDWVLWDSSRGMVAGTDPRLALNSTAAEVNQNWVYTTTGGFQIVTSDAAVNASGGSYIFLSVA